MTIFDVINKYLDKLGSPWDIIFGIIFILVIASFIRPYIKEFFKSIKDAKKLIIFKKPKNYEMIKKTKNDIIEDVMNHQIMTDMKEIKLNYDTLDFGDAERNRIFKLIINTQIDINIKYIKKMVNDNDIDNLKKNEFKTKIFNMLYDISFDIDRELKQKLGDDVFDLVINSKKGFKAWSRINTDITWNNIKDFFNLNYIKYNHLIFNFILTTLSTSITITFNGIENRFSDFNGDLTKLIKNKNI
jgi:hypothetical protein